MVKTFRKTKHFGSLKRAVCLIVKEFRNWEEKSDLGKPNLSHANIATFAFRSLRRKIA